MKEAFSSGVETTLLCEQITIGMTSFGELLSQRRSQRRPKQKCDLNSTECIRESQKNKPRREAPRRNVMESKHTEAAPDRRAEDGGALNPRLILILSILREGQRKPP